MSETAEMPVFGVVESDGPGGRLVLRQAAHDEIHMIVISGFQGPGLPSQLTRPAIEPATSTASEWRLRCGEGEFRFRARAVDQLTERPALFTPMHRAFALSCTDRLAVRVLLWLLRLPGGARLLRHWQARRS